MDEQYYKDSTGHDEEIVDKAADTVPQSFDLIRQNPLAWAGGAIAGGFLVGRLALNFVSDRDLVPRTAKSPRLTSGRRTLMRAIAEDFAPELRSLKEVVLLSATRYAADSLRARTPEYRDQISQFETDLQNRFSQA